MKLFMMPHTVPKRPTNGAVAPDRCQHAGAADHLAAAVGFHALEPRGDPLLDALAVRHIIREAQFFYGCVKEPSDGSIGIAQSLRGLVQRAHRSEPA
jgi:hypothetical protein